MYREGSSYLIFKHKIRYTIVKVLSPGSTFCTKMLSIESIFRTFVAKAKDMENRITKLFNIKYPVIQGGMVWCSGWRLASAVSNNGGLGLLGAGSMHPETLVEHIHKTQ